MNRIDMAIRDAEGAVDKVTMTRIRDSYATDTHEQPLAIEGLTSYRYRGVWGWVMIGATDVQDALSEASRTDPRYTDVSRLQVWDGQRYVAVVGELK